MYRDYVILAISLLVIALILGGIRVRNFNFPYLYFLFGIVVASFLLTDPALVGQRFINVLYPLFVPFLFMIGPGIYGSIMPMKNRRDPWHIIHYLPVIIGFTQIFLHWFLAYDDYTKSVITGRQFQFETNQMFFPFSDQFILLGYPVYTAGYYLLTIRKLREFSAPARQYILPVGLLIFSPFIFDVVYHYVYGEGLIIQDPAIQRYVLLGAVLIILWDVVIVKPPKPKEVSEAQEKASKPEVLSQYPFEENVSNEALLLWLEELHNDASSPIFRDQASKDKFITSSPYSTADWEQFFAQTNTHWNFFKKFIRVKRAIELMKEGFLLDGSIDELSSAVGYSSRASLYSAFRQVVGTSLPDFRLEREL